MNQIKLVCHICQSQMAFAYTGEVLTNCTQCGTDLIEPHTETIILSTVATQSSSESKAKTHRTLMLTNKRLIIADVKKKSASSYFPIVVVVIVFLFLGWLGLILAALTALTAYTIDAIRAKIAAKNKLQAMIFIPLNDIASLTIEPTGLSKGFRLFTISTKDGNSHSVILRNSYSDVFNSTIATKWEEEINSRIAL